MMCVLLGKDARTNTGLPPITNESLAEAVRNHPDTFIGFGAVDPYMGKWAAEEVHRIAGLGLRGLKFQQIFQGFFPNDERVYPIYEAAEKLGLVALFHMGTTGIGAGMPGGMGLRLKYGQPMHVDDVAADFPNLTIIAAHPGWPWSDEVARTLLQDKMLFGSDWPMLTIERWQREFAEHHFPDAVVRKIMLENAKRVLRLEQE